MYGLSYPACFETEVNGICCHIGVEKMGNKRNRNKQVVFNKFQSLNLQTKKEEPPITSLLDLMEDEREFSSLLEKTQNKVIRIDLLQELQNALKNVETVRNRPVICYMANTYADLRQDPAIREEDILPFSELLNSVPKGDNLDVILVTPGGSGQTAATLVEIMRRRFKKNIQFILPDAAMSAGTIMAMSGNEIIMTDMARIGPIDPQVQNKYGRFVPAQSLLNLIEDIKKKGEEKLKQGLNPDWVDIQILLNIDPKEIGDANSATKYATSLVCDYLQKYKFANWNTHSDGTLVSEQEKKESAERIANFLCNHAEWKSHGHGISKDTARKKCGIKIVSAEETPELSRALKRFWALCFWSFRNQPIIKLYLSTSFKLLKMARIGQEA